MNILKNIFPLTFMTREKDTNSLVISIVLYVAVIVAYFILSCVLGFLFGNVVSWLLGLFGILVGLYGTGGVVLAVLVFCGILK